MKKIWEKIKEWWYKLIGKDKPAPDPVPPTPPTPLPDTPVPVRTNSPYYKGNGILNSFTTIQNGKNPTKKVSLRTWVKINSWPRKDVGASLINKGSVGRSWAYALVVQPDNLMYGATLGAVRAKYKFLPGVWYYVRIDATSSDAKFWVNGYSIPVTQRDTNKLFSTNADPLRIGGHTMDWNPPSAWFNGSLDGEMSDWIIEVE